ncbi:hypothetical protein NUW58_g7880 [Xylaria curta]|uniref:Uncharacterized protein n=1 Tax=Xylaria curta TaxID=42375 RepID=A0ACC1ND18_9PEZI|nr:hypothetical protein NUW58_g7880 [Xylaria curta]
MTTFKKVNVTLMDDEDVPTCFKILSDSFGHDAPFVEIYFPNHDTPAGQAQGSNRLAAWKHSSPHSKFLKAVTSIEEDGVSKERIVGFAIWTHMKDIPPQKIEDVENVDEVWPDPDDRRFMAALWGEYVKPRTQAVEDAGGKGVYGKLGMVANPGYNYSPYLTRYLVLELLVVRPDCQRLGAGAALVTWGLQASDELRVRAVVESTPAGRRVYEKCGMRAEIEVMRFDLGEEFSRRATPKLTFLTREPGS